MQKFILMIVPAILFALPALSHAANVCYQNDAGGIFRLSIKPACKATSSNPAAVVGTVTPAFGVKCLGSDKIGVHGVCFGVPSEGKVHLNLISERVDHSNPSACSLASYNLIGEGLNLLTGSSELETDSSPDFEARTFTAIPCP